MVYILLIIFKTAHTKVSCKVKTLLLYEIVYVVYIFIRKLEKASAKRGIEEEGHRGRRASRKKGIEEEGHRGRRASTKKGIDEEWCNERPVDYTGVGDCFTFKLG